MKRAATLTLFSLLFIGLGACDKNNNISLFSVQDDIALGAQVAAEIASDPANYPLLPEAGNEQAYAYIQAMTDEILNSGEVQYRSEFAWEVHIIEDDVLNAFCTPGGYIYVYTGLIKYLDNVDDLAGVMGHEIAHADLRHTSRQMQNQYGISTLLAILLGDNAGTLEQIAADLAGNVSALQFSKKFEAESDDKSVLYLSGTEFACNGAASFFEKLEADGQGTTSGLEEFLSTHPSPENRIADINAEASELGCSTSLSPDNVNNMTYAEFQALFQ
ncbi:M48 family metalloprotease [Reichenbachiella ulvae]|uniref:M48 family metalloprotease n=1 Tax=Reichenbachiella ulvae TaxID=2980104 RepID=A0ABT3CU57_9BACT|nr:M48 family metalloprotease [Reichenbachiella ulvae]MCV9387167.1 M48 family metalloprotease [Reichenbachiella ulvae]